MIADSADIKFACPQCGQRIVVDKSAAGLNGSCPICEGPVVVPHASSVRERSRHAESEMTGLGHEAFAELLATVLKQYEIRAGMMLVSCPVAV